MQISLKIFITFFLLALSHIAQKIQAFEFDLTSGPKNFAPAVTNQFAPMGGSAFVDDEVIFLYT